MVAQQRRKGDLLKNRVEDFLFDASVGRVGDNENEDVQDVRSCLNTRIYSQFKVHPFPHN